MRQKSQEVHVVESRPGEEEMKDLDQLRDEPSPRQPGLIEDDPEPVGQEVLQPRHQQEVQDQPHLEQQPRPLIQELLDVDQVTSTSFEAVAHETTE